MAEKRLYQLIAKKLLGLIDSGSYPVGSRLPAERDLAEMFGVSRVTVRDAAIWLEAMGRVEVKMGSGLYVSAPQPISDSLLPKVSPFELTQSRLLFESECAALAATLITDSEIVTLEDAIQRMADDDGETSAGDDADRIFHFTIAGASKNASNIFILEQLWQMRSKLPEVKRVYSAVCKGDSQHRVKEHSEILNALKRRNPGEARQAMRNHFSRLLEALLNAAELEAIEDVRSRSQLYRQRFLNSDHVR